jgi:Protein of unknown function (DUF3618)
MTEPEAGALRDEIERTRAELGETVEALAARTDVKARVRESAAHRAEVVKDSVRQASRRPVPWIAIAAGAAAVVALLVWRGRRP